MTESHVLMRPIQESYWVIPGSLLAGEYPGVPFSRDITRDRLTAFLEAGFNTYVNLTRAGEAEDYAIPLQIQAGKMGIEIECLRFSIRDFGLPNHQLMTEILEELDGALARGRRVYVHCYGGIGRTGMVVGCFLVRHGYSGAQALQELAVRWKCVPKSAYHPRSPETPQQEQFILDWVDEKNK